MNPRIACTCCAAAALLLLGAAVARPKEGGLVVHEWGTFLSMNGSDGITLDGMYHEEHALPGFVHSRRRDQLHLPGTQMKGETPVIYFYTDRQQKVSVHVDFPAGIWTQWYPQANMVGPKFSQTSSYLPPKNGRIAWYVDVVPPAQAWRNRDGSTGAPLPATSKEALWNFARQVDAAYLSRGADNGSAEEWERFIFYRGLGRAELPLEASMAGGGTLSLSAGAGFALRNLVVLRVENGRGAMKEVGELAPGGRVTGVVPDMATAQPVATFESRAADRVAHLLVEAGLYEKEARAMVNTWRSSYFESDGIRVLYLLPQSWTEQTIPMRLDPKPDRLVRVMVGRTEMLTPARERAAEDAVRGLASSDAAERERAFDVLRAQGRYVEPLIRRTLAVTKSDTVRSLCRRLLLTDFVTELHSAVNAPLDGRPLRDKRVWVRAQLASLLHEAGMAEQARAEGGKVMADMKLEACPPLTSDNARHYLRGYARALEGVGDDRGAAAAYARLVRFGSQVSGGCNPCHEGGAAPKTMAWFRDWYAGRKYASYVAATGSLSTEIAAHQARLAQNPADPAARLQLAYLYEQQGARSRADAQWAALERNAKVSRR